MKRFPAASMFVIVLLQTGCGDRMSRRLRRTMINSKRYPGQGSEVPSAEFLTTRLKRMKADQP